LFLGLVGARVDSSNKKGADHGIDGRLIFHDEAESKSASTKQVLLSVKSGKTSVAHVRDLRGVVEREGAAIGVLITLQEPTGPMRAEAAGAGFYEAKAWGSKHAKIQILSIKELLAGRAIGMPATRDFRTFKKAPKSKPARKGEAALFEE
jgi:site-specific DNA-methyltransferase (adenine-specific)